MMTTATTAANATAPEASAWCAREIALAVDAAGPDPAAVALAVGLARHFAAGLLGVLVEDAALLRAAGLPFTTEIARHSGSERPLDAATLERRYRQAARDLDELLGTQGAVEARVRASRGRPAQVLAGCFATSDILVVGHAPPSRWRARPDSTPLRLERSGRERTRLDAVAAALQTGARPWPWQTLRPHERSGLLAQLRERRPSLLLAQLEDTGTDNELNGLLDALDCPIVLLR